MKKGFAPILLIVGLVAVILLIAGGAYYFGKRFSALTTTNPIVTQSPASSTNQTSTLQTYTNSSLGLTFQYPQGFAVTLNQTDANSQNITITSPATASDQMHITLTATKNTQNITLGNYLQALYGQPSHPGGNPAITVDGIFKDFKVVNTPIQNSYSYVGNFGGSQSKVLLFSNKDEFYSVALYGGTGAGAGYSAQSEKTYDSILSTFKFTN